MKKVLQTRNYPSCCSAACSIKNGLWLKPSVYVLCLYLCLYALWQQHSFVLSLSCLCLYIFCLCALPFFFLSVSPCHPVSSTDNCRWSQLHMGLISVEGRTSSEGERLRKQTGSFHQTAVYLLMSLTDWKQMLCCSMFSFCQSLMFPATYVYKSMRDFCSYIIKCLCTYMFMLIFSCVCVCVALFT